MNIAIDIRPLVQRERTGVGEYTYELLNALFSIDSTNQYFLFCNSFRDISSMLPEWNYPNVHIIWTRIPNKLLHMIQWFRWYPLDQYIEKTAKQQLILKAHESITVFFSPNLHFTYLRPSTGHILTIHDLSFEHAPEWYTKKQRWWHRLLRPEMMTHSANTVIVPSENTKQDIVQTYHIPSEMIQVVYPGVSTDRVLDEEIDPTTVRQTFHVAEKYVLFVGTHEPRKNIDFVTQAFLASSLPEQGYQLVLVGANGWNTKAVVRQACTSRAIRSLGYVSVKDKWGLYQEAACFVYPSLYEGFGIPVLEAMSVGVPVITTNRTSLPEVVAGAARLVSPMNVVEMIRSLEEVVLDSKLHDWYSTQGKERARFFSWSTSAKQVLELFSHSTSSYGM